jgi:hypothetical protein
VKTVILFILPVLIAMIRITGMNFNKSSYTNFSLELILSQNGNKIFFNPKTGLMEFSNTGGNREMLSDSAFNHPDFRILIHNDSLLRIDYPDMNLICQLTFRKNLDISAEFPSTKSQTICWPSISVSKKYHFLIWPKNEGYYIPFSDSLFAKSFDGDKIDAVSLSLPFWAVEKDLATTMYELVNPFHNEILFEDHDSTMVMKVRHRFTPNAALKEPHSICITHLSNYSPITPAQHFRKKLEENHDLVTLADKIKSVPLTERMIGAPMAHLIPGLFFTKYDIREGKMISLARAICEDGRNQRGLAGKQWNKLEPDQRDFLNEVASSTKLNNYQQVTFIRIINKWFNEDGMNDEFAKDKRKNAELFYNAYSEYLYPPAAWGDGASIRMIDALKSAGIDHVILQAEGHQFASDHKEAAGYAFDQGFLFGIYDSYHSIHDPSAYGTDDSWETAQMPEVSFDSVRMINENGTYYIGFRASGGQANPKAIRNYFEFRVNRNFNDIPYSYYFIDCDAFGEYYDDFSTLHPLTRQEDAAERIDRLNWLRAQKKVPIGSEKGISLFSNVLDINEGVATPLFGFRDKDMRDKNSEYFTGGWWPPEMSEIKFKEVPLKEKYKHLHFDPRFKIPLWETVYHDCLISTAHPASPSLKYSNVKTDVALTEMFYQYPPLYNLNYDYFRKNKDRILHHYKFYSKTHPQTVKYPVSEFEFLTRDRLVQRIQFGNIRLIANYRTISYSFKGYDIPGKSLLFIDEDGVQSIYNPEEF